MNALQPDLLKNETVASPYVGGRQLAVAPKEPSPREEDFDWTDDETVVLQRQLALAIYHNNVGGLVIRQERDWNEDEDTCIVISPENIDAFVDRLTDVVGIPSIGGPSSAKKQKEAER